MTAFVGDPKNWKICPSFFTCGTPMASNAGSAALTRQARLRCSQEAGRRGRLQGREDHPARCGRPAADPCRGAGHDRGAEKARAQCRIRGQRLGYGGDAPRLEKAAGRGRLEHVRDRLGRLRHPGPVDKRHAARQRREGLVRLADRRQARRIANPMAQGERHARSARISPPRFNSAPSRWCPMFRPGNSSPRPPTARTSRATSAPRRSLCGTSRRPEAAG